MDRTAFLDELRWRDLFFQCTEGAERALADAPVSGYCGFDPTAASLHVGSLVQIMGLVHLQRAGHRPIALVGGGTGLIGDPSGKANERPLADRETVAANAAAIGKQLERFLDFSGPSGACMRNNIDWLEPLQAVDFLRDVGKHFSINAMLAKESVKTRLDTGISFTEFAYMLLQAYDFQELYRRDGVTLQTGGSDQWGNITLGVELLRRSLGVEAHGVTLPLVTRADGSKFGKTEGGNVWLDPALTSPYKMYQFWINTDDRDAGRYLKMFTLMVREEVEALEQALAEHPERREAQTALAFDVTARVHGQEAAQAARDASGILFDRHADPQQISPSVIDVLRAEIPFAEMAVASTGETLGGIESARLPVIDALVVTGLAKSKGEARRQIQQGAVTVNGHRLAGDEHFVNVSEAIAGNYFLIRRGAREMALVRLSVH